MNEIKYFSMFTGVGGFELGLEKCCNKNEEIRRDSTKIGSEEGQCGQPNNDSSKRFTCIGMSEIDKYSSQVLKYKFPTIKNWGDCTKINPRELPDFDMLCGGFPCQSFSIAGKRRGFEDTRGTMFFEIARIIKVKKPKTVFLENVKGLLNHNKGETFRVILQTLDELGYEVQWMVLNSKFFGVPQNRERVFIIGNLRGTPRSKILPFNGIGMGAKNPAVCLTQRGYGSQRNGTYVASDSETKIRRLTPVECCRLQGFPDDWNEWGTNEKGEKVKMSDTQRYKQMGNAVTVNVIRAIGGRL